MFLCPLCKSETVRRKNKKTGVEFIGCSAWPKCKFSCDTLETLAMKRNEWIGVDTDEYGEEVDTLREY